MKRFLFFVGAFLSALPGFSQALDQVAFSGGKEFAYFSILTDREVQIRLSIDGTIMSWGIEMQSTRNNQYFSPTLQPYIGRVDYYGPESDSVFRGKPRSIGSSLITYYGAFEKEDKRGKLRSIGSLFFDYYDVYDNKNLKGKLRYIGSTNIQYYTGFEDPDLTGKLRTVGNTVIAYYNVFDDRLIRGKIKSIGPLVYKWYTSLEVQYGGGLKSGLVRQNIGGVTYILQQ
jgi:hypothetical protein